MSRRRTGWIAGITVVLLAAGAAATGYLVLSTPEQPESGTDASVSATLYTVERRDLVDTLNVPGVLDFGDQTPLASGLGGVVTGLPGLGSLVDRNGVLFRVDNNPVVLMIGTLPAWRGFDVEMSDGPDVTQLEDNLRVAGFFDEEPDEEYDWVTREAVEDWQESLGMPRTGQIDFGRVVFEPEARRVGAVTTSVGDQIGPGTEVLTLTSQVRTVTVQVPITDQRVAAQDAPVTIRIPGGLESAGKIVSIGSPTEVPSETDKKLVVPVEITLDDPGSAADLQRISVTAMLQREVYEQVLTVPVTALIGLAGGGLGVEKQDGSEVVTEPVDVGAFVQGFVEITSGELAEGDQVVVPE